MPKFLVKEWGEALRENSKETVLSFPLRVPVIANPTVVSWGVAISPFIGTAINSLQHEFADPTRVSSK
jgi:hypothetical protein